MYRINSFKQIVCIAILGIVLPSCDLIKTVHLLKQGEVSKKHFKEEITFEERAGIIILKIKIENEFYDFIFDTGAPNAVSLSLAEKLKLKTECEQKAVDSEGRSETAGFATIEKLSIGTIDFSNTACAIIDLEKVPEIKCINVQGLIGGNLMRKSKWQIDYKNQKIIFTSDLDSLLIPKNTPSISFKSLVSGTPTIYCEVNGIQSEKAIFDTGSSGEILLTKKDLDKLIEMDQKTYTVRGIGSNSSGLYGRRPDTSYLAKVDVFKLGDLNVLDNVLEFKNGDNGNIGSGFLKNYIVTIDWDSERIWFQIKGEEQSSEWSSFGFVPAVKDGKMYISLLYDDSPAIANGLLLNDQILSINGIDFRLVSEEAYCEMIVNKFTWKTSNELEMLILSDGIEKQITLTRKDLFNK